MMAIKRWIGVGVAVPVVALALYLGSMRAGLWNPSYEDVKAEQAGAPSKFVQVGDVTVHYRDEGTGPVILMLHSSMTNLRIWDGWADQLKDHYRVVRLDWPPYGLSVDPKPSTGSRGVAELVEGFIEKMKLNDITLVGSSSGATLATLYAANHPEKVRALALSALPLAAPPPTEVSAWTDLMVWTHENLVPNYYPRYFYKASLSQLYGTPSRLKPETVEWYYQTNNVAGGFARVRAYYQANLKGLWKKGASGDAAKVAKPILLQWGDRDRVLPKYLADKAVKDFSAAKVELIHYPDVGHYPMLELPVETGRDLRAWLDKVTATPAPAAPTTEAK
jgi:pimeloyl-ACP methyl ester carboxylesterase